MSMLPGLEGRGRRKRKEGGGKRKEVVLRWQRGVHGGVTFYTGGLGGLMRAGTFTKGTCTIRPWLAGTLEPSSSRSGEGSGE